MFWKGKEIDRKNAEIDRLLASKRSIIDTSRAEYERLLAQRDEARAEVERLREVNMHLANEVGRRGSQSYHLMSEANASMAAAIQRARDLTRRRHIIKQGTHPDGTIWIQWELYVLASELDAALDGES